MKIKLEMTGGLRKEYNVVRTEPLQETDQVYRYRVQGVFFEHNYKDGALVCASKALNALLEDKETRGVTGL